LIEKLKAILKISRPVNIIITFVSVIVAAVICLSGKLPGVYVFLAAVSAALTAASGNVLNDFFDIEIDKVNRPIRSLPSGKITINEARVLIIVLAILSLVLSFLISYAAFIIVFISNVLLFLYSKLLKGIPLVGNITVAFLTGLVFIFGGVVVGNLSAAIIPAVFAFLINLIREVVKDMQDIEGDEKSNIITFPIKYGFKRSKLLTLLITFTLILCTLFPFVTQIYRIEYFVIVMVIVNPILVYCMKILFDDHSLNNLNRISNLLKLSMVFGLIAIFLGV
jgi:geranylgeranylglycerol-phosphate geranylgeranyltransferase